MLDMKEVASIGGVHPIFFQKSQRTARNKESNRSTRGGIEAGGRIGGRRFVPRDCELFFPFPSAKPRGGEKKGSAGLEPFRSNIKTEGEYYFGGGGGSAFCSACASCGHAGVRDYCACHCTWVRVHASVTQRQYFRLTSSMGTFRFALERLFFKTQGSPLSVSRPGGLDPN